MKLFIYVLELLISFVLLERGSFHFVEAAEKIAQKFKIPQSIIGLTIVAMGTSIPEAAVSITAAFDGNDGITVGNIVGSNILNIWIILGISSVLITVYVAKASLRNEICIMIGVSMLMVIFGWNGQVDRLEGIVFLTIFVAYLIYLFCSTRGQEKENNGLNDAIRTWIVVCELMIGIIVVLGGSKLAVYAATLLAQGLGVLERMIGLTIVALGTSLPELFTSVVAARKGNADIAVGNIVGSNIFNILFIIGTTSIISKVPFSSSFRLDGIIMVIASISLLIMTRKKQCLNRLDGIIMLVFYLTYVIVFLV